MHLAHSIARSRSLDLDRGPGASNLGRGHRRLRAGALVLQTDRFLRVRRCIRARELAVGWAPGWRGRVLDALFLFVGSWAGGGLPRRFLRMREMN